MEKITRRQFLQIAGGITYLAFTSAGCGVFAAKHDDASLPLFTALPYIQPGTASTLTDGGDTLIVAWQTQDGQADFEVAYGLDKSYSKSAKIITSHRFIGPAGSAGDDAKRINYHASLTDLKLGQKYYYRVKGNGKILAEGFASTRKPRGTAIRFVSFGDNSCGSISDHAIAYQAYKTNPDFVMNTGDNVYDKGLDSEYARNFFPVYNADTTDPSQGAPLLRSVPFYTVLANHDLNEKHQTVCDFDAARDVLGYYTAMHMPLNGPAAPAFATPLAGNKEAIGLFRDSAGPRYPQMANYSFDYGDAHFLCLDANTYIDPTDPALQSWIESDLSGSSAVWKFAVFHHPPFNVGGEHYGEQHMRALSPLFEKHGVDIVLNGHEHTYQRTMPLRFDPKDISRAKVTGTNNRLVPGNFTVDRKFDGSEVTKPDGVIYIVTGAGGNDLYDPGYTDNPAKWLHPEDNNVAYVAKFYSALHSLTIIDIDGKALKLSQVNEQGEEIDHIRITKA